MVGVKGGKEVWPRSTIYMSITARWKGTAILLSAVNGEQHLRDLMTAFENTVSQHAVFRGIFGAI